MYQFKSRVRFSEVDSQLHMTLPSIINYFQDCSTFHSDSIGYGIEVMMEQAEMPGFTGGKKFHLQLSTKK